MTSALWAQCAARQDKFWIMHDLLFDRQPQWQTLPDPEFFFRTLAGQSGLDTAALESCVRDPRTREVVMADKLLGESRFIRSTPTYFINGKMTVGVEALRNKLEDALGMM